MNFFKTWGFMRLLRLVFGAFAIVQAIITQDIVLGILGATVGGTAFLNFTCCCSDNCGNEQNLSSFSKKITNDEYEEVVIK
ncbi:MAG: hypothetical protein SFY56_12065 [Bacteroidota bacterium]|nr:hypothetical protein [Bacteroidota bacterium]